MLDDHMDLIGMLEEEMEKTGTDGIACFHKINATMAKILMERDPKQVKRLAVVGCACFLTMKGGKDEIPDTRI